MSNQEVADFNANGDLWILEKRSEIQLLLEGRFFLTASIAKKSHGTGNIGNSDWDLGSRIYTKGRIPPRLLQVIIDECGVVIIDECSVTLVE